MDLISLPAGSAAQPLSFIPVYTDSNLRSLICFFKFASYGLLRRSCRRGKEIYRKSPRKEYTALSRGFSKPSGLLMSVLMIFFMF